MSLEGLRGIVEGFLVDSKVARRATVYARNALERLLVIKIIQNDLINPLRRVHEIEDWSIAERGHNETRIESGQPGLKPVVIRQHGFDVFLDRVALPDVFVQLL